VKVVEKRTGLKIACVEEVAYKMGYINKNQLGKNIEDQGKSSYADYLKQLL